MSNRFKQNKIGSLGMTGNRGRRCDIGATPDLGHSFQQLALVHPEGVKREQGTQR